MKKLFTFLLCVFILTFFVGCNAKKNETATDSDNKTNPSVQDPIHTVALEANTHYTLENVADFSLFKIYTSDRIVPTMGSNHYYPNNQSGETYIDIILDWTNLAADDVDVSDWIQLSAVNEKGIEYTRAFSSVETSNATNLNQFEEIASLSTARVHCALSVPTTETNVTLKLTIDHYEYVCSYTLGSVISTAQPITIDEIIQVPNHATFVLKGCEYTDEVRPSDTDTGYSHYTIDHADNTYLVLKFDITNHAAEAKDIDSFTNISAVYTNQQTFTGFTVVEEEDGKGFDTYADIASLATHHFYHLIEVPKTITEHEVTFTIAFNSQEYTYTYVM